MIDVFYYDKSLKKGGIKDLPRLKKKMVWIDITHVTDEEAEIVKGLFDLHPLTAEDLLGSVTRIKIEVFSNYLFCVFYGIAKNKALELIELDFVIGRNFLITQHVVPIQSFEELKKNEVLLESIFRKGHDFIFHYLIDEEVANFFPVLEDIDEQLESLEESITKKPKTFMAHKILTLKRELIRIKRIAIPQREKLSTLTKNDYEMISKEVVPYLRDVYDHSIRVADSIENLVEQVTYAFEIYMSAVNNTLNEVMKVLSVIATIALPLTVISSIYGTNFHNLPGIDNYYGFWFMIAAMVCVSIGMILFFRKKGWF